MEQKSTIRCHLSAIMGDRKMKTPTGAVGSLSVKELL